MGVENNIPEGWLYTELGKVSENIFSGGTPNTRINKYWNGSLNWLSSGETGSNFIYSTIKSITQLGVDNSSTRLALKDDVVVATAGQGNTRGQVSFMSIDSYINQSIIAIRGNKNTLFNKWLFYNLSYRYKELRFISESNSVRGSITTKMLSSLIKLKLPPLPEQKAIANVLTAFDDKIELLQAQNKTLETMAQTIFKEWFGKYQIGDELPEGWRVGKFGEVIEFINGYAFKSKDLSKEPIEDSFKVFKMGDIKKGGGFNPGKTKGYFPRTLSQKLDKYILKNGDLLMSMTDMKDAISLLGHTALMIYDNEYIVNQRVGLIRANNDIDIEYPYLYLLTNNEDFIAGIRASANSGVQVNLSTQGIKETEFIIADKETNKAFNKIVMPLFEKRKANTLMIKELKKTRDTLLPKLMSGQVRVKNLKQTADA